MLKHKVEDTQFLLRVAMGQVKYCTGPMVEPVEARLTLRGYAERCAAYGWPGVTESIGHFMRGVVTALAKGEQVRRMEAYFVDEGSDTRVYVMIRTSQMSLTGKSVLRDTNHFVGGVRTGGGEGANGYRTLSLFYHALEGVCGPIPYVRHEITTAQANALEDAQAMAIADRDLAELETV